MRNIWEVSNSILWITFQFSILLSRRNTFRLLDQLFNSKLCNLHKNYESPFQLPYIYYCPLHSMNIVIIMTNVMLCYERLCNHTTTVFSEESFGLKAMFQRLFRHVHPNLHQIFSFSYKVNVCYVKKFLHCLIS